MLIEDLIEASFYTQIKLMNRMWGSKTEEWLKCHKDSYPYLGRCMDLTAFRLLKEAQQPGEENVMSTASDIQAQIDALEAQLAILNSAPSDTFNFGTIVRFAANSNTTHFHYIKVGEETWRDMQNGTQKDLATWILQAVLSNIGYFEVYVLTPGALPIYASA